MQLRVPALTSALPRITSVWWYIAAMLVTAAITLGIQAVEPPLESATIALLYLLGVLALATTAGLGPSIFVSLLSFLAFNFFFVPPLYTFHVENPQNVLRLLTFLVVAIIASGLAARARTEAEAARHRAAETTALYDLSQAISAQVDLDHILPAIAATTCQLLRVPACAVLLADANGRMVEHTYVGRADSALHTIDAVMADGTTVLGMLRVIERAPGGLTTHERRLLDTLAAQARLAIGRAQQVVEAAHIQALAESDQLKSALISSVSHDLRTPLAVIKGAVSTLLVDDLVWDTATQRALAQTIDSEADHLNRIVGNLLSMSRIESGALPLDRDWQDLAELIGSVLHHMAARLSGRTVTVDVAPELPLVAINATLIDQLMTNLLENAIKYTPPGTPITINAGLADLPVGRCVTVAVRDFGPGIPADQLARIFDKFHRVQAPEGAVDGSGLGLAICRGIITAHGGQIWAENCWDGGARFTFTFPHTLEAADLQQQAAHTRALVHDE